MNPKFIIPFIILSLLLTACSPSAEETASVKDGTAKLTILDKNSSETEAKAITLSMRSPETLNPINNSDATVDTVLKLIFEPLFNISEEQSVIPNLGASYILNDDGMSLSIRLKEGLKWADGEPVTADDIVYTLRAINNSPDSSVYKSCLANVSGFEATDSLTAVIYYSAPYSSCIYNLCFPLIPSHYYSSDDDNALNPLGCGAYALTSKSPSELILTASQGVNGKPSIQTVRVILSPDEQTDFNAFSQGITNVLNTSSSGWNAAFSDKECTKTVYSSNNFEFFGFNNAKEMFKEQAVRQAVAYCIDIDQIISGIYMNNMDKSLTPVNPTAYMSSADKTASYGYSPSNALKTLQNKNISPNSLTFTILVNGDNAERVETANIIAASLNQTGMHVSVVQKPYNDYITALVTDNFDTFIGGTDIKCGFDLRPMLSSSFVVSDTNYVNFSDPQMDTLLNEEMTAVGEAATKAALGNVEQYISVQLPLIGIGFKNSVLLTSSDITGITIPYINNCFVNAAKWNYK